MRKQIEYVRIAYLTGGSKRRKRVWAKVLSRKFPERGPLAGREVVTYLLVNVEGEDVRDNGPSLLIGTKDDDVFEQPARMNLTYAQLELAQG